MRERNGRLGMCKAEYYEVVGQPHGKDHVKEEDPAACQQKKGSVARRATKLREAPTTVGALLQPAWLQ